MSADPVELRCKDRGGPDMGEVSRLPRDRF
jgi:hypothetical protein